MMPHRTLAVLTASTLAVGMGSTTLLTALKGRESTPSSSLAVAADAIPAQQTIGAGVAVPGAALPRVGKAGSRSKLYFGVSISGLPSSAAAENRFTKIVGKKPNLVQYYQSFDSDFDVAHLRVIAHRGQLPMVTWEPWNYTAPTTNPDSLKAMASGKFDLYLRRQALLLKALGSKVAIRLAPEMNGNWFPWGQHNQNRNTPAQYVAMYRHVHNVFTAAGVRNVIWVWSPNVVSARPNVALAPLYPGAKYVDVVGVVGYLRTQAASDTFKQVYPSTLAQLNRFAATKPILICETGVAPGPNQVGQLKSLFQGILTTPRMVGFVWFDNKASLDWRLEGHPAEIKAFRKLIASPRFGGSKG